MLMPQAREAHLDRHCPQECASVVQSFLWLQKYMSPTAEGKPDGPWSQQPSTWRELLDKDWSFLVLG